MRSLLLCLALALVAAPHALAQCTPGFVPGDQVPGVSAGAETASVNAGLEWDFDGAGPDPTKLIVGGDFTDAGGSPASFLALWDGHTWTPFGLGANAPITRLVSFNGQVIAAGQFTSIGGVAAPSGFASYDGSWHALPTPGGTPTQLLVWNGLLYATGHFTFNSVTGDYVASFDGSAWSPVGAPFNGPVNDVSPYQGQLLAGGTFTNSGADAAFCLARWDGAHWTTFQGGTNDTVNCLKEFGPDLYVGGVFNAVGPSSTTAYCLAKWSGSAWQGISAQTNFGSVTTLGGTSTILLAGGYTPDASGSARFFRIAGDNLPNSNLVFGSNDSNVNWIGPYQNNVHVGGSFRNGYTGAGSIVSYGITRFINSKWHALTGGFNGQVFAMSVYQGQLIAAGDFIRYGDTPMSGMARWTGSTWVPFNSSFPSGSIGTPTLMATFQNKLWALAGTGLQANWDGSSWQWNPIPMGTGAQSIFEFDNRVFGGVGVGWRQMGAGADIWSSAFTQPVWDAIPYGTGSLIGGAFTTAGGVPAKRAAYYNGSTWSQLGAGFNEGTVVRLLNYNGQPAAFGTMINSGSTVVNGAALWDGAAWQPFNGGSTFTSVKDALVYNNQAYALVSNSLKRYNGATWNTLGSLVNFATPPFNGGTRACAFGNDVWVMGRFTHAAGLPSFQLARYQVGGNPAHIDADPAPVAVHRSEPAVFTVAASGDVPLSYQWRHNTFPLGAPDSPTLTIPSVTDTDRGIYDCVVSSACGPATSAGARLTVLTADLGQQGGQPPGDTLWDNNDFVVFLDHFFNSQPDADLGQQGGLPGGDGLYDNNDFVVFLDLFFGPF